MDVIAVTEEGGAVGVFESILDLLGVAWDPDTSADRPVPVPVPPGAALPFGRYAVHGKGPTGGMVE